MLSLAELNKNEKTHNMKIAAIQMCSSSHVQENLLTAQRFIEEAASNGAKLVLLPEMFAIMGLGAKDKVTVKENFGHGAIQDFLSNVAKKNNIWIVGGTIPIACDEENKVRAACIVWNDLGEPVCRYDKIHLFDVVISESECYQESETIQAGDPNHIVVINTPVGKLGLCVCYDLRFPELFLKLMEKGVEVIAVPSAFTVTTGKAHFELLTRGRAIDTFSYVIGGCQGGTHDNGRQTYGHSLIVDPWGAVIAHKEEISPGVIYATIDRDALQKIRRSVPIYEHRRMNV